MRLGDHTQYLTVSRAIQYDDWHILWAIRYGRIPQDQVEAVATGPADKVDSFST